MTSFACCFSFVTLKLPTPDRYAQYLQGDYIHLFQNILRPGNFHHRSSCIEGEIRNISFQRVVTNQSLQHFLSKNFAGHHVSFKRTLTCTQSFHNQNSQLLAILPNRPHRPTFHCLPRKQGHKHIYIYIYIYIHVYIRRPCLAIGVAGRTTAGVECCFSGQCQHEHGRSTLWTFAALGSRGAARTGPDKSGLKFFSTAMTNRTQQPSFAWRSPSSSSSGTPKPQQ